MARSESAYVMSTCSLMLYRRFPEKASIISLSLLPDCDLTHQLRLSPEAVRKETGIRCWISTPQQACVPLPCSVLWLHRRLTQVGAGSHV